MAKQNGSSDTGTVKWFSASKGYGFIAPDGKEGQDVFVHYSNIDMKGYKQLAEGQRVEFVMITGTKGRLQAGSVRLLEQ